MNAFISKLVFQIICGTGDHTPQFDEQLRLIVAENAELAYATSMQLGETEQCSFYNMNEELVRWKFTGIADLQSLGNLQHGAEIYSAVAETDDEERYIHDISLRTKQLRDKFAVTITAEA